MQDFIICLSFSIALIAIFYLFPYKGTKCMFYVAGMPLLGSTLAFARHGADCLAYAAACSAKFHAFSIQLLTRRYIFLSSPTAVKSFATAPMDVLALYPAVAQFTGKCFGISQRVWQDGESIPGAVLRRLMMPHMMRNLSARMASLLLKAQPLYLPAQGNANLADALPAWVMHATLETIFGTDFTESIPLHAFMKNFDVFDTWFEVRL
jgi:hypothetical protein